MFDSQALACFRSCVQHRGWLDVALGGAILGAGMTLAGAVRPPSCLQALFFAQGCDLLSSTRVQCPGMVIIQVGAGAQQAGYTVVGLFLGG
jgi:hypothetical protein